MERVADSVRGIPSIGLGTFGNDRYSPQEVAAAVGGALQAGYRYVDCAAAYGNEVEIGEAVERQIRAGVLRRDELTLSSKVWNDRHAAGQVGTACEKTLRDLRVDYLDLYLVHWPFPNHHPPGAAPNSRQADSRPFFAEEYMVCWEQMERLVDRGLVRSIGMSNMTIPKLDAILPLCRIPPAVHQMEIHPGFQQPELFEYCRSRDLQPVAFSPLGSPIRPERDRCEGDVAAMDIPEIREIARAHDVHPAAVCLKWAVQRGQVPIPFSVNEAEYSSNLRVVAEDPLTKDEMERIAAADRNCRLIKGVVFLWSSASSWHALWDEDGRVCGWDD